MTEFKPEKGKRYLVVETYSGHKLREVQVEEVSKDAMYFRRRGQGSLWDPCSDFDLIEELPVLSPDDKGDHL